MQHLGYLLSCKELDKNIVTTHACESDIDRLK